MRAIAIVVVLSSAGFGLDRACRTSPPAPTPAPAPKPDPAPPGRTWESRTMRTTATSTTAAWRKSSTRPLEVEARPAVDAQPRALLAEEKETVVFLGEYRLVEGARIPRCIPIAGGGWACGVIPVKPAFEVTEVLKGTMPANANEVLKRSALDANFKQSRDLKERAVYTFRFTPSDRTRRYLREPQKADEAYILSSGDELEVIGSEFE